MSIHSCKTFKKHTLRVAGVYPTTSNAMAPLVTGLELASVFLVGRGAKSNELAHGQTILLERQYHRRDGVGSQREGFGHVLFVSGRELSGSDISRIASHASRVSIADAEAEIPLVHDFSIAYG
jgi:hypothetical protein